jgi:Ca-activated chloride channel family protein
MRTALALLAVVLAAPAAAQAPDALLIFDASNSMWGRVDGRPKIVIAREAVAQLARALPAGTRMGLMAFGHRRPGDCADIELVLPPAPVDPAEFAGRAAALTPRGRTPLTAAITRAAETLGARDRPARIVVLSDGIETCHPDPCGAARALKATAAELVVHVIGFDVADPSAQAQLACIAEATGGRFVPAGSAADLAAALAAVTATAPPPVAAQPPPPPAPPTETNLTLEASEIDGGPSVPVGTWTLVALTDPPRAIISGDGRARPSLRVPAGRYEARVTAGTARVAERFDVSGAEQVHRVVLNIGTLRARGLLAAGGPQIGGNWTVLADEVPGARPGESVATSGARDAQFRLVQGSYRLRFRAGEAEAEADVFVPAGQTVTQEIVLNAAQIAVTAMRAGRPVGGVLWEVAVREPDARLRRIASSGAAVGRFTLPAGSYVLRVRVDGTWRESPVTLAAGQTGDLAVTVD